MNKQLNVFTSESLMTVESLKCSGHKTLNLLQYVPCEGL